MELADLFKREESFCTLCLRQPGAARLKRCTMDQIHAYTSFLEVAASSPYVCGWCAAPLRCIARLQHRARRAQAWLKAYYTSDELPEALKKHLLAVLNELRDNNLKCVLYSPTMLAEPMALQTAYEDTTELGLGGECWNIETQTDPLETDLQGRYNLEHLQAMFTMETENEALFEGPSLTDMISRSEDYLDTGNGGITATSNTTDKVPGSDSRQTMTLFEETIEKTPKPMNISPFLVPRRRPVAPVLIVSGVAQAPTSQKVRKPPKINQIRCTRVPQKKRLPPTVQRDQQCQNGWDSIQSTLEPRLEKELAQRVCSLDDITAENVKMLAYDFAELKNVEHNFDRKLGLAGDEWLEGFLKRHLIQLSENNVKSAFSNKDAEEVDHRFVYEEVVWESSENDMALSDNMEVSEEWLN